MGNNRKTELEIQKNKTELNSEPAFMEFKSRIRTETLNAARILTCDVCLWCWWIVCYGLVYDWGVISGSVKLPLL